MSLIRKFQRKLVVLSLILTFLLINTAFSFDAAATYEKKCASCHSIGGGDDVGPDLKDVSKRREEAWLIKFIQNSQAMIASGDSVAVELFQKYKNKKMPEQELSDSEVKEILAFIASGGQGTGAKASYKSALKATDIDYKMGEQLFLGTMKFSAGGPACISCHSAGNVGALGGGTLGPDLTHSYSSYNDNGLSKVLTKIGFPSMVPVYKDKALNETEVFQVKSFLYKLDRESFEEEGFTKKFLFMGIIGFLLLLGLFDLIWKARRNSKRK